MPKKVRDNKDIADNCEPYCKDIARLPFMAAIMASFLAGVLVWWLQSQNKSQNKEQI